MLPCDVTWFSCVSFWSWFDVVTCVSLWFGVMRFSCDVMRFGMMLVTCDMTRLATMRLSSDISVLWTTNHLKGAFKKFSFNSFVNSSGVIRMRFGSETSEVSFITTNLFIVSS
ncbi:MAG: hypothetical protein QXT48_05595 [Thermoplasmatales archaeon]